MMFRSADHREITAEARQALDELLEGNRRFVSGKPRNWTYRQDQLHSLSQAQSPKAAIIACVDSRVSPEIIFDQPLGSVFVSRVPGNVASDSAKWMIDIAVGELNVPLLVVLGHSGCLAVGQIVEGKSGSGGLLRFKVQSAVQRARSLPGDLYTNAVEENARQTVEHLADESWTFRDAMRAGQTSAVAAYYDMPTGVVKLLD